MNKPNILHLKDGTFVDMNNETLVAAYKKELFVQMATNIARLLSQGEQGATADPQIVAWLEVTAEAWGTSGMLERVFNTKFNKLEEEISPKLEGENSQKPLKVATEAVLAKKTPIKVAKEVTPPQEGVEIARPVYLAPEATTNVAKEVSEPAEETIKAVRKFTEIVLSMSPSILKLATGNLPEKIETFMRENAETPLVQEFLKKFSTVTDVTNVVGSRMDLSILIMLDSLLSSLKTETRDK